MPAAPGRVRHPQRQAEVPARHDRPAPLRGEGGRRCHLPEGGSRVNAGAIVIVGAGQAGGWAATTLRDRGYDGRIVLLGDEPHAPYERPPLSKAVLSGQALAESTELFAARKLESMGIEFEPGVAALRLRLADKRVDTSDGRALAYDKLILCSGGRPTVPALPGVDHDGVHVRTRADAERLRARLGPDRHVLIVGGGWIGLEVAATARQSGSKVTVLEREARLRAQRAAGRVGASGDAARGQRRGAAAERRPARRGRIGRRPARGGTGGRLLDRRRRDRAGRGPHAQRCWRATPALPAIAACWWTSVAAHRRRTYAAGDVAVSAQPAAAAAAGVLAERAGPGHGGGAVGAGPGRSVSADRRGLVGAIRRHGADRRLSGAGGQRGAAAASGCPRAAVGGAGCGRPRRGGRDSERGARTAPAA